MATLSIILFLCIAMPMVPVLFVLPDRKSRLFLGYMLVGVCICLIAGQINTILLSLFDGERLFVTTNITPISEEILKALPVLYFAVLFSDDRNTLVSIAFALGIGFAILENAVILVNSLSSVTIAWAFARGMGAALMHGICTSFVGMGMSYVKKRRKFFFCGTFALLITAIIYHGIFNTLVQSDYKFFAFIMPSLVCCAVFIAQFKQSKK